MKTSIDQETTENLLAIFSALVAEHFDGIDPFQIHMEDKTEELLSGNGESFYHVVVDFLQFYHIDSPIEKESLFQQFPTVGEVIYFIAKNLID